MLAVGAADGAEVLMVVEPLDGRDEETAPAAAATGGVWGPVVED